MKLSIVIAAYNRPEPLARLLKSVDSASRPKRLGSTRLTVYSDGDLAKTLDRPSTQLIWDDHVGLKKHLIRCIDFGVKESDGCILLEDDLMVSPFYLHWAKAALDEYKNDSRVAAISLFSPQHNEYYGLPFIPIHNGCDSYFLQVPSSSGIIWTEWNWQNFREFYAKHPDVPAHATSLNLPEMMKTWPDTSLKKHIAHYLLVSGKTLVYPRVSFATNFGDPGTHLGSLNHKFQTPICYGLPHKNFVFSDNLFYDSYYEPRVLIDDELVPFDTLRLKRDPKAYKVISCCDIAKPMKSWGLRMLPIEANVIHDIPGDDIHLGYIEQFSGKTTWKTRQKLISYYSRFSTQTPDLVDFWKKRVNQCLDFAAHGDRTDYNLGRSDAFAMCADELERTPRIE